MQMSSACPQRINSHFMAELEKLVNMRSNGFLDEAEFKVAKQRLLQLQ